MFSQMATPIRDISASPGLILQVGPSCYRVVGSAGSEIAPCPVLAVVPNAPYWLLGVGLYKNEAVPVVHLQALLEGHASAVSRTARMLVLHDAGRAVAYLVDDVDADPGNGNGNGNGGRQAIELDLPGVSRVLMAHAFLAAKEK